MDNAGGDGVAQGLDYFPEGMILQNKDNKELSRYSGGQFHLISIPVWTKMGLTGNDVAAITADQYNKVTKGNDYFPEGMLIQNMQNHEVDLYSGGQRHAIPAPVWLKMNVSISKVTTINASQFNGIPRGRTTSRRVRISRTRTTARSRSTAAGRTMSSPGRCWR